MKRSYKLGRAALLMAISFASCLAQQPSEPPNPVPLRKSEVAVYSGELIDTEGVTGASSPANLVINMLRCSLPEELAQVEQIRAQKNYRDKLTQFLLDHTPIGEFRISMQLAHSFKLIACRETPKGRTLLMAANRFSMPGANAGTAQDPRNYPFTVIVLRLDANGSGTGTYYHSAKLRFNKKHEVEVEDYLTQPANITNVHPGE
jgi:hypothetical protein